MARVITPISGQRCWTRTLLPSFGNTECLAGKLEGDFERIFLLGVTVTTRRNCIERLWGGIRIRRRCWNGADCGSGRWHSLKPVLPSERIFQDQGGVEIYAF